MHFPIPYSLVDNEYKESIINIMTYTTFIYSIPDLYSFPDESNPHLSLLALLSNLLVSNPRTSLRTHVIHLFIKLFSLGSYPVHRLLPLSVELIYPSLMKVCGECLQGEGSEEDLNPMVQLMTTLGR